MISLEAVNIKELLVFIDGPKNNIDKVNSDYIKYIAKNSSIKNIKIISRKKNLGLSQSLLKGINFLAKNYKQFIVIEDDCVVYNNFFDYFEFCFKKYNKNTQINNICSFQFKEISKKNPNELNVMFFNHFLPWGWGTWSKKWKKYNNAKIKKYKNTPSFVTSLNNKKYKNKMKNNIWTLDYLLYQYHLDMYSIFPNHSLCKNIGFDGSGVNSKSSNYFTSKEVLLKKINYNKSIHSSNFENMQMKIIKSKFNLFY